MTFKVIYVTFKGRMTSLQAMYNVPVVCLWCLWCLWYAFGMPVEPVGFTVDVFCHKHSGLWVRIKTHPPFAEK
jgi:hypothetical protein